MHFYAEDHDFRRPSKLNNYSFQLLDDQMRRRKSWWQKCRFYYLCGLFTVFAFTFGWEASRQLASFIHYKAPFLMQGCFCNNENFCFTGLNTSGLPRYGKPFDCSLYSGLKQLNLLGSDKNQSFGVDTNQALNLGTEKLRKRPTIVTSVDADNYQKLDDFIATLGRYYDNVTIVVYDLGMDQRQVDKIKSKWCEIGYERINQSSFGENLKMSVGTESLVLIDAFVRYHSFVYFQLGVQIKGPFMNVFLNGIRMDQTMPIALIENGHKNALKFLDNDYLPVDNTFQQQENGSVAGLFVVESAFADGAFKWFYLCLHTKDCNNFTDPPNQSALHTFQQITWRFSASQLFAPKRGTNQRGAWPTLTNDYIKSTLQRYHRTTAELNQLFSFFE